MMRTNKLLKLQVEALTGAVQALQRQQRNSKLYGPFYKVLDEDACSSAKPYPYTTKRAEMTTKQAVQQIMDYLGLEIVYEPETHRAAQTYLAERTTDEL
jgi:hypothetical protein